MEEQAWAGWGRVDKGPAAASAGTRLLLAPGAAERDAGMPSARRRCGAAAAGRPHTKPQPADATARAVVVGRVLPGGGPVPGRAALDGHKEINPKDNILKEKGDRLKQQLFSSRKR